MSDSKENSCAFYASDYHLEMIMLPYINKNLKNNKSVYVFTENDLEDTISTLVAKVNLEKNTKEEVLNINWKKDDESKYNKLINDKKESVIFVKGNKEYINKVNNNLKQFNDYKNIEVIDCYNLEQIDNKSLEISQKYSSVLNTEGKIYNEF